MCRFLLKEFNTSPTETDGHLLTVLFECQLIRRRQKVGDDFNRPNGLSGVFCFPAHILPFLSASIPHHLLILFSYAGACASGTPSREPVCCPIFPNSLTMLFVVRPQPDDFHRPDVFQNLVHQSMLYVDAPGTCSNQISDQFFEGRRILIRIQFQDLEQSFSFWL